LALAGHSTETAHIALNGRYMNYGQWPRHRILEDYGRASTFAGRIRQPFKESLVDHAYQRRKASLREERLSELGLSASA